MLSQQAIHPQGPTLSRFIWGAWRMLQNPETSTAQGAARLIAACLDMGVTSFDHADIYGGYRVEEAFGEALAAWGGDRSTLQLITKCDIALVTPARPQHSVKHYNTSAAHIAASVETSLRLLRTDYLDVLLLHRPDPLMAADETAQALDALVAAGKVRAVGVSNHTPAQINLLQSRLSVPLVTNQIELSVLHTTPLLDGTLDQAQQLRMRPMIWSPLGGGGLFTGTGARETRLRAVLAKVGAAYGCTDIARVAYAWLLRLPSQPLPVLGTGSLARIESYIQAEQLNLKIQDWFEIYQASLGHEVA